MRKALAILMSVSMVALAWPVSLSAQQTGGVQGVARDAQRQPLGNTTIQLRNAQTGELVGSSTANAAGEFSFAGINPGNFVIEIVDAAGNILGTATATVTAGAVTTVAVTATAAGLAAAAAGAGGLAALFSGTSLLVISAVTAGAIVVGVTATRDDASPSR